MIDFFFLNIFFTIYNDEKSKTWRRKNNLRQNKSFSAKKRKEENDTAIKSVRNLFRLKKEIKGIKDIVLRILRTFFSMKKNKKIFVNQ